MNKRLVRLTESDLHRIVKGYVKKIISEAMDTAPGQFQGGRLAYKKGEERPIYGQNVGKLRKDPNATIFNYAEKAAKKSGLKDYGKNYKKGYEYQNDLDDFQKSNDNKDKIAIVIRKILRGGPAFNRKLCQIVGGRSLDDLSDEELLDIVKNVPLEEYFPQ